jgi:Carboxypeptidase regulatory-like domain
MPMRTFRVQAYSTILAFLMASIPALAQTGPSSSKPQTPKQNVAAVAASKAAASESAGDVSTAKVPVRRVILYKTGVGYFEHEGQVRGDQQVQIDFTSSQLNDVLQSLTILDLSGGRISGVNYNSEAPLSQRLGMLHLPLEERTDLSKFYAALRGARLEVRNGSVVLTGRLLSVERKTRVSGGTTLEVDLAMIVTDSGEVRSFEITPAVSVRLAEREVSQEVNRYVDLLASMRQESLRRMTISTAGTGERQLYVSYISEVPIWKTTYRIVLSAKDAREPLLQGWAIVDNTVGEDWDNIELSLVAGAPHSFIQQLSQPYYARRPVVALPENAQLAPQTHESAMLGGFSGLSGLVTDQTGASIPNAQVQVFSPAGEIVASTNTDSLGQYKIAELPAGIYRVEFASNGFQKTAVQGLSFGGGSGRKQDVTLQVGASTQTVEVTASTPTVNTETSSAVMGEVSGARIGSGRGLGATRTLGRNRVGAGEGGGTGGGVFNAGGIADARRAMAVSAEGTDLGDLFEYKLKDRVTIHKNQSALVPILQVPVGIERVSLWNPSLNSPRPLRALNLTNSSALTLDGGSFSVLDNETFAGEGLTEAIKPGEKRLISYAADLGVRVESQNDGEPQHISRVRILKGTMIQTSEFRQQTSYLIRNDDTTPRIVLIEHPLRAGWKIGEDAPKPEETTSALYRFRKNVEPKATTKLSIWESKPIETRYELTNLTNDQIEIFLKQRSINPEIEQALDKIIQEKDAVAAFEEERARRDDELQKIYDDQQRLRENLKALKGSAEERALTQRYTQQLNDQETRLEAIQREEADLETKKDQAQAELDKTIENLALEATL